jgi:NADH-quinone oxidoreductase subunit L
VAIALLLFVACAAKSAQLPLYMWLPDAMEGPTPVSALIHAATMVTAGVYLVARANPLFENAPVALSIIAGIGGATALFAASIALFQLDIKRVLAYSTISQLGYMFIAEGVHNYGAGVFHLVTHAFFKALLFLGAGAVIHALAGEQDMRNMGGLRQRLPITFWTFLGAVLAISGIPPFAGFWSKDDILSSVLGAATSSGNPWLYVLWGVGLLTAGLTAFYMFRLFFGIFIGTYRGEQARAVATEHEEGEEVEEEEDAGHGHGHAGPVRYYDIQEVPSVMSVPLIILGVLSVIGGFVGSFALIDLPRWAPLPNFLAPVFQSVPTHELPLGIEWASTGLSILAAGLGFLVAWRLYRNGFLYKENKNPLYQFAFHKYYVDEALDAIIVKPIYWLGGALNTGLEIFTLDGLSRGIGWVLRGSSAGLRRLQTGYMRNYALAIMLGVVLIVVYYIVSYAVRG